MKRKNKLGKRLICDEHPADCVMEPIKDVHSDLVIHIASHCGWLLHQGALNWLRNLRPYGLQLRIPRGESHGTNE